MDCRQNRYMFDQSSLQLLVASCTQCFTGLLIVEVASVSRWARGRIWWPGRLIPVPSCVLTCIQALCTYFIIISPYFGLEQPRPRGKLVRESRIPLKTRNVTSWTCCVQSSWAHRTAYAHWPFSVEMHCLPCPYLDYCYVSTELQVTVRQISWRPASRCTTKK